MLTYKDLFCAPRKLTTLRMGAAQCPPSSCARMRAQIVEYVGHRSPGYRISATDFFL